MNVYERITQQMFAGCADSTTTWHMAWSSVIDPNCVINRDDDEQETFDFAWSIVQEYHKRKGPTIIIGEIDNAHYDFKADTVICPCREQFLTDADYYCTIFHEIVHSTGHETRIKRNLVGICTDRYGDYCEEELIAELGALYLCGVVGYNGGEMFEQSIAYIKGYKNQTGTTDEQLKLIADKAMRAVAYILGEE